MPFESLCRSCSSQVHLPSTLVDTCPGSEADHLPQLPPGLFLLHHCRLDIFSSSQLLRGRGMQSPSTVQQFAQHTPFGPKVVPHGPCARHIRSRCLNAHFSQQRCRVQRYSLARQSNSPTKLCGRGRQSCRVRAQYQDSIEPSTQQV